MRPDATEPLSEMVLEELRRDPRLDASRLSVDDEDGAVTLRGTVRSYAEKCCAESIVRELRGVATVSNDIEVRLSIGNYRTDRALRHLTNEMLENQALICDESPRATVHDGWVSLSGVVRSEFHKHSAEATVRELAGVRGITNRIEVLPQTDAADARRSFEAALRRRGSPVVGELSVAVSGATMTVHGIVQSCAEHDDVLRIASRTRGIAHIEDHLAVRPIGRSLS